MNLKTLHALTEEYNAKYFNGVVNVAVFAYHRKGRTMGFHRVRGGVDSIHMNLGVTRTDNEYKGTLLHEMTHAFLHLSKLPSGHTPWFKRMMKNIYQKEFGFTPTTNVRFTVKMPVATPTKEVPVEAIIGNIQVVIAKERYKVISNGMVGEFLSWANHYGRKMINLKVEGMLYPFVTELTNVQKVG